MVLNNVITLCSLGTYHSCINARKLDTLVSGTNIKTVGGTSILGNGNIPFPSVLLCSTKSDPNCSSTAQTDLAVDGIHKGTLVTSYAPGSSMRPFVAPSWWAMNTKLATKADADSYLPLTGGTVVGQVVVANSSSATCVNKLKIGFNGSGSSGYAYLGVASVSGTNLRINSSTIRWGSNEILHAGNYLNYICSSDLYYLRLNTHVVLPYSSEADRVLVAAIKRNSSGVETLTTGTIIVYDGSNTKLSCSKNVSSVKYAGSGYAMFESHCGPFKVELKDSLGNVLTSTQIAKQN